ncbi:YciI family protein [Sedimenticola sp.]|uniref:YciI family protein n=1 Tax=Sedimenticola sp. TaxID=1940285 RepID=UPI003D13EAAA
MPQYILVYLGGEHPSEPEQRQKHMEAYQQWMMSLGDAVVSPAVPFKDTHTVRAGGSTSEGSISAMSGMTILRMDSMQEALAAAQSCPFLEINGTLEVSEMVEMAGDLDRSGSKTIN